MNDAALLSKYGIKDGTPYMKWAWNGYAMEQFKQGKGGLVYVSELLKMGSPESVSRNCRVSRETAAYLLEAARYYAGSTDFRS